MRVNSPKKLFAILIASIIITILVYARFSMNSVYIGAWSEGFLDTATQTLHADILHKLEQQMGKKLAIAHIYRGWHDLDSDSFVSELRTIGGEGWVPLVSTNPYFFDRCKHRSGSLYKTISQGDCDVFLKSIGKRLRAYGKPVFVRFAWEMNIPSNEWSIQSTFSTPAEFVGAWRHIHDVIANEGARNVQWVFCPQINTPTSVSYKDLYPGDMYVDWAGLDGYNWGVTQSWSSWQSFDNVFGSSYDELVQVSGNKPVMIAEFGTTDKGGDKPAWFSEALNTRLLQRFPRVRALIFYDEDRSQKEGSNWKLDTPPETMNAIKDALSNPLYRSTFP